MNNVRRIIGFSLDDYQPIFEPYPGHSITQASSGAAKTTSVVVPGITSLLPDHDRAIIYSDIKNGEITAQITKLCEMLGRTLYVIDDFNVLKDHPCRVKVNPYSGIIEIYKRFPQELLFECQNTTKVFVKGPPGDAYDKNKYWNEEPQLNIEWAIRSLLDRNPDYCHPGASWQLLSDNDLRDTALRYDAEEGGEALRSLAQHIIEMRDENKEHFPQHLGAALRALRSFEAGCTLHGCGHEPDISHLEMLKQRAVVAIVGPQRHMDVLGPYITQHLKSFVNAQLTGEAGEADYFCDEFTNTPSTYLVEKETVLRSYKGRVHKIYQSRSEFDRKFGKALRETAEENAIVKQYLSITSFDEAARISKAMGEELVKQNSLSSNMQDIGVRSSVSYGKQRVMSAASLMKLPPNEQIIYVRGVGWIHCLKAYQNQIAPFCHHYGHNPMEGPPMKPDVKATLPSKPINVKKEAA